MPNVSFGPAITVSTSFTDVYVYSTNIASIPARRLAANGLGPQIITHLYGYVGGRSASRTVTMILGSSSVTFTAAAKTSAAGTGYLNSSDWYISNGDSTVTFRYNFSGSCYYARGASGTRVDSYTSYTGALRGAYTYIQAPAAPTGVVAATGGDGVARVSWVAPDNGGSAITGYNVQYTTDASFLTGVQTIVGTTSDLVVNISNLESGQTYYFKVAAKNLVTTTASTTSAISAVAVLEVPSYGIQRFNIPTVYKANAGTFWSLGGHVVGFDGAGTVLSPVVDRETYDYISLPDMKRSAINVDVRTNAPAAEKFTAFGGKIFADDEQNLPVIFGTIGSFFDPTGRYSSVNKIAFKTFLSGDIELSLGSTVSWKPKTGNYLYDQEISVNVKREVGGGRLEIRGAHGDGTETSPISIATEYIDLLSPVILTNELALFIFYAYDTVSMGTKVVARLCNTSNYSTFIEAELNYTHSLNPLWNDYMTISGPCRSLYLRNNEFYNSFSRAIAEYENEPSFVSTVTDVSFPPASAVTNNMWSYLQDACSATRQEIAIVDDVVTVRNVGIREIDPDNFVDAPNVSISATLTGLQVDVNYTETKYIGGGEIYSARKDNNKVLSVKSGETIKTTIQTSSSIISINQPFAFTRTKGVELPEGVYEIMDSSYLPIKDKQWLAFGGKLFVASNPDIGGAIDIYLTGPLYDIPGTTGPYSIAVADGASQYASLSITGSAVEGIPKTLNLLTGSSRSKTVQVVATTISNPFISTTSQAYDAGITAANVASGPNVSLSGSISAGSISSFGLAAGSLIKYRNNIFRVTDATVSNMAVSFNAVSYVTVSDLLETWPDGSIVSGYDYVWEGNQSHDGKIAPLSFLNDPEVFVFPDTDYNPYFSSSTLEGYSVLLDTDNVPYFDTTYNVIGSKLIYLDIDTTPYYKI